MAKLSSLDRTIDDLRDVWQNGAQMFVITNQPQLSLFEQIKGSAPTLSDEVVVSRICEEILDQAEVVEPPISVEVLASLRGITRIEEADQPFAGMLQSADNGLEVRVRRLDGHERKRFTVCHEAGHTLFPGYRERQFRCDGTQNWLERMCDLAGAELLLPRRLFEPRLDKSGFDLDAVDELSATFEASVEATAHRAVSLHRRPAMLVRLSERHKPREAGHEDQVPAKLRVDYSVTQGDWPFVLRHKSALASGLARALDGEILDEIGNIDELLASPVGRVRVSARRYGKDGRVLALIERPD